MSVTKPVISIDDGCASDVRAAELGSKYGAEMVFYWPVEWHSLAYSKGYEPLTFAQAHEIADAFEIGSHGITHRLLTQIPEVYGKYEIYASKDMIGNLFAVEVTKFAPARGYIDAGLMHTAKACYETVRLTKQPGLVHIHPDSGANGNKPWRECVNEDTKELFCHSWELDKYDLWGELESFLSEL